MISINREENFQCKMFSNYVYFPPPFAILLCFLSYHITAISHISQNVEHKRQKFTFSCVIIKANIPKKSLTRGLSWDEGKVYIILYYHHHTYATFAMTFIAFVRCIDDMLVFHEIFDSFWKVFWVFNEI